MKNHWFYKQHKDFELFDEIRLETSDGPLLRCILRPRYKTSDLSGDEWRVSAYWQMRTADGWDDFDGGYRNIEIACMALYPGIYTSHPTLHNIEIVGIDFYSKGNFRKRMTYEGEPLTLLEAAGHLSWARIVVGERDPLPLVYDIYSYCFQPGCSEKAISTYKLKLEYTDGPGFVPSNEKRRRFCLKHLQRGDCGLEDADDNYEVIEGPGPKDARGYEGDISESAFGGFINDDNLGI